MASQTKKVKRKRSMKKKANKSNLKADMKRLQRNREILKELAAQDNA